ncbi:MAG: leucine-rich repeat domain-containing protein [Bacteroidota bacterium]
MRRKLIIYCLGLLFGLNFVTAQSNKGQAAEIEQYEKEVRRLVQYLESTLNVIGAPQSSSREKEIIIRESYQKIFRDEEVQIEDDLVETRSTITNKDVQAYLQDVDFFFRTASFELLIDEITHEITEAGEIYFKVGMSRHLQGILTTGDSINNIIPRYLEINLNEKKRDLKIVSMYSRNMDEDDSWVLWWNSLSYDWKKYFSAKWIVQDQLTMSEALKWNHNLKLGDTLVIPREMLAEKAGFQSFSGDEMKTDEWEGDISRIDVMEIPIDPEAWVPRIKELDLIEVMDLAGMANISSLKPLSRLTSLKRLDISGTSVSELDPLRNLTHLEELNCANTLITDLNSLRYALDLRKLNINDTEVHAIEVLRNFRRLTELSATNTKITDLRPLAGLGYLKKLNLSASQVGGVSALASLKKLAVLDISHSEVRDLMPLRDLFMVEELNIAHTPIQYLAPLNEWRNLRTLIADHSGIKSLRDLEGLESLRKIYCDHTAIGQQEAERFMQEKAGSMVIYNSAALQKWWRDLTPDWRSRVADKVQLSQSPDREELQKLTNLTSLNLSDWQELQSLEPLKMLSGLQKLDISGTRVKSLDPLKHLYGLMEINASHTRIRSIYPLVGMKSLRTLDINHTEVDSLKALAELPRLQHLNIDHTRIFRLNSLMRNANLQTVYADGLDINERNINEFINKHPDCLLVYRTESLQEWWKTLPQGWQKSLRRQGKMEATPTREDLHRLILSHSLSFTEGDDIHNLGPLGFFKRLTHLQLNGTQVSDLKPLSQFPSLLVLDISRNPVSDLSPLSYLSQLTYLSLENTPVEDLSPVANLKRLQELLISGTQVKDLKSLTGLYGLQKLNCSNTEIRSLKPIENLQKLNHLTIFNTKLSPKKVDQYRLSHSRTQVVFY